ncbi:MAG: hypothetical protein ACHQ4H_16910, partial [Ktedonobacterales bacterium]
HRTLNIMVADITIIHKRQPVWKRPLPLLLLKGRSGSLTISQQVLGESVEVLAQRIDDYIERHAPPNWLSPDVDEDDDEASDSEL